MRTFYIDARNLEKWMHQNRAVYTGAFFEGCLLDNFILGCSRGYAAVHESYVNPNMSRYLVCFAPYKDFPAVDKLFSDFITAQDAQEKAV